MNLPNLAHHHLQDAKLRLDDAYRHRAQKHYHLTVRACQETVELALKAALRFANIDPPKQHNVAKTLRQNARVFPEWFRSSLERWTAISIEMEQERIPSMYGDEANLVPPSELYTEDDAVSALDKASQVLSACEKLIQDSQTH